MEAKKENFHFDIWGLKVNKPLKKNQMFFQAFVSHFPSRISFPGKLFFKY